MNPKIKLLPSHVADQIAAGEVVERPSSVVKELVENALDAGAGRIRVDLEDGGRGLIRVSDDGEGMGPEDLGLAVLRHATSKISGADDLQRLRSFGFRGEALPSIASVSLFRLLSRTREAPEASELEVEGGRPGPVRPAARAQGTTVEVRRLFYNTPARLKFLKTDSTETGRAQADLGQLSLAHPGVAFQLGVDGRASLELAPGEPLDRLRQLWGASAADQALALDFHENGLRVAGWILPPQLSRGNRSAQWLFVNRRPVEHRGLGFHLNQAYGSLLPHGRHAVAALFVELDPGAVDVNVHPAKREVRFRQESTVLDALRHAVAAALRAANLFAELDLARSAGPDATPAQAWGRAGSRLPVPPAPMVGEATPGSLLEREVTQARPSHVQASPWGGEPKPAPREDWPVPLAQLHKTYLLCQDAQGLVLVDQHAAHERVLFERQLKAWIAGTLKSQRLLLPQRLQVGETQAQALRPWMGQLAELGLELQDVGAGLFFVTSLPEFMKQVQAGRLLQDLLEGADGMRQPASGDPTEDLRREAAAQLACKAAIKAGDALTWEAMQQLMSDLAACEIPWSCPHGRPPLVRISLAELEKHFLRR